MKPGQLAAEGLPWGATGLVRTISSHHCLSRPPGSFTYQREQHCKGSHLWFKQNLKGITGSVWVESLHPGDEIVALVL